MSQAEDARRHRFGTRIELAAAWAWLDRQPVPPPAVERIPPSHAAGRLLAAPVLAQSDVPADLRAAIDGYAVTAADTEGASTYNPIPLAARPLAAGSPLPPGTDAILPLELLSRTESGVEALATVAPGDGTEPPAARFRAGAQILPARSTLRPQHLAALLVAGIAEVPVLRPPSVAIIVRGAKSGPDALGPMLHVLVQRDGGRPLQAEPNAVDADMVLIAGRSGIGTDDDSPALFAHSGGRLDHYGIAMRPGGSAGLGSFDSTAAILLPGEPLACFAGYTLLASRVIRRFSGRPSEPQAGSRRLPLARKIVSAIGYADFIPVALKEGQADPLGPVETLGAEALARADGYVLVPEASEGHAAGEIVAVHLYPPHE